MIGTVTIGLDATEERVGADVGDVERTQTSLFANEEAVGEEAWVANVAFGDWLQSPGGAAKVGFA